MWSSWNTEMSKQLIVQNQSNTSYYFWKLLSNTRTLTPASCLHVNISNACQLQLQKRHIHCMEIVWNTYNLTLSTYLYLHTSLWNFIHYAIISVRICFVTKPYFVQILFGFDSKTVFFNKFHAHVYTHAGTCVVSANNTEDTNTHYFSIKCLTTI